jgi:K+-sensing histidine kinase KdpD
VGLDLVTGGHLVARAAAELDGSRSAVQKLVRGLLENPSKAKDFLENPQEVAAELGVRLSESDAKTIKESLIKLAREADAAQLMPGHQDWVHQDGTWHDSYNKTVTPKTGTTTTKPPKTRTPGGTRRQ